MDRIQERETLDRQRAAFAYERVCGWEKALWGDRALAAVKSLPITMRAQGLSVTLATLMNKEGIEYRELAGLLAEWIMNRAPARPLESSATSSGDVVRRCLEAAVQADRRAYLGAQREALALLEMVKVMAQAIVFPPAEARSTLEEKPHAS